MPRADLLALDVDELAALTNRGTVKRAIRELESGEPDYTVEETDAAMLVNWSDGIVCTFPSDAAIKDATCSSGVLGISRHLIRSVLAYQKFIQEAEGKTQTVEETNDSEHTENALPLSASSAWDPGQITDQQLDKQFGKAAVTRARKRFEAGVLGDLSRGRKPTVKFLHDSCTIRFPVPHDLRYATGDCEERLLSTWVPQAVWAFRELAEDTLAGLVMTGDGSIECPQSSMDQLQKLLAELCQIGVANLPATWAQRLSRVQGKLEAAKLIWPASLCESIDSQFQSYRDQDARFDPVRLTRLVGELKARLAVIENDLSPIPHALVCGPKSNGKTALKKARLVAVGLDARPTPLSVVFRIFFQDSETGSVLVLNRTVPSREIEQEDAKSFDDLGSRLVADQSSVAQLAKSIVVLGSGKRTATDEIVLPRGRGKLAVNAQSFLWEKLAPPFAAESFEQIKQRLQQLPPDWLRPRRGAENLHAIRIEAINNAFFDVRTQRLMAVATDIDGGLAKLVFPYHSQGHAGFDQFLEAAMARGEDAKFICGHVRLENRELVIVPVSVVFETDDKREIMIPWLAGSNEKSDSQLVEPEFDAQQNPISEFLKDLSAGVGDALITGWENQQLIDWETFLERGQAIGFSKTLAPIKQMVDDLRSKHEHLNYDANAGAKSLGELCIYLRLFG